MKTQKQFFTILKNSKVVNNIFKGALGVALISSVFSCRPDDSEYLQSNKIDGQALLNRFEDNRENAIQEFTIDAASGGIIYGTQGTEVVFQPNSFGIGGVPVTGNVKVQLVEIYDKASMLLKDKSTLGMRTNGDKEALKSAGEFFIDAQQGGNELELIEMANVSSRPVDFSDLDSAMQVFRAGDDLNDDDDWVEADEDGNDENDDVKVREAQGAGGEFATYTYNIGTFGWTNLDRWYSYTGAKTDIFIDVPNDFDEDNCAVYLSYDGEPTALARMDVWSTELEMFTEHYGLIPVGLEVHIIMVAEFDGQLQYAIQGTTVVDDHVEVMPEFTPISQPALEALINGLP